MFNGIAIFAYELRFPAMKTLKCSCHLDHDLVKSWLIRAIVFYLLIVLARGQTPLLPAALREAQICRYLVYSEADFEVFRPAGATRYTDGGEIWHVSVDRWSAIA